MLDKNTLSELLVLEKSISNVAFWATIESANKKIKEFNKEILDESLKLQDLIYNYMKEKKYYNIENVKNDSIKKSLDQIKTA